MNTYQCKILQALTQRELDTVTLWEAVGGSVGSLHVALDQLEEAGLVTTRLGPGTPERGGRRRRYAAITGHSVARLPLPRKRSWWERVGEWWRGRASG